MIDYETFSRIKHLYEQKGLSATQIARELGLDERTVNRRLEAKAVSPAQIRPTAKQTRPLQGDGRQDDRILPVFRQSNLAASPGGGL